VSEHVWVGVLGDRLGIVGHRLHRDMDVAVNALTSAVTEVEPARRAVLDFRRLAT
jgi:hypothetical protein